MSMATTLPGVRRSRPANARADGSSKPSQNGMKGTLRLSLARNKGAGAECAALHGRICSHIHAVTTVSAVDNSTLDAATRLALP